MTNRAMGYRGRNASSCSRDERGCLGAHKPANAAHIDVGGMRRHRKLRYDVKTGRMMAKGHDEGVITNLILE